MAVAVGVGVAESMGVIVGVAVGDKQNMEPVATTVLDVSSTSNVRVPKRPLVLILKVWPAVSWKVFCAIGVPFRLTRQVKGVVISPPVLVMVMSPIEFGAQAALTWKDGGTRVGVAVGDRQNMEPVATTVLDGIENVQCQGPEEAAGVDIKGLAGSELESVLRDRGSVQADAPGEGRGHIPTGIGDGHEPG